MIETAIKVLPFDETLPEEIKKLEAEGWQLLTGTKPIVTYQVGRTVPTALGGEGGISVDDSKVTILRNGKVLGHG